MFKYVLTWSEKKQLSIEYKIAQQMAALQWVN